jgi:hypothetical protein
LRGAPIFNDYKYPLRTGKYLFDITYNVLIILIMVAIITGIIIDTFADLRSARDEVEDNIMNVCFVCSLSRDIFERNRIKFSEHIEKDHHPWNYLYYWMVGRFVICTV